MRLHRSTTAQLRDDIDSGRTGDKVRAPDPAAAPLGTDDEAAGSPPCPRDIAFARRTERGHDFSQTSQEARRARPRAGAAWTLIIFIVVLAAILIIAAVR